jgi:hypothetical protein
VLSMKKVVADLYFGEVKKFEFFLQDFLQSMIGMKDYICGVVERLSAFSRSIEAPRGGFGSSYGTFHKGHRRKTQQSVDGAASFFSICKTSSNSFHRHKRALSNTISVGSVELDYMKQWENHFGHIFRLSFELRKLINLPETINEIFFENLKSNFNEVRTHVFFSLDELTSVTQDLYRLDAKKILPAQFCSRLIREFDTLREALEEHKFLFDSPEEMLKRQYLNCLCLHAGASFPRAQSSPCVQKNEGAQSHAAILLSVLLDKNVPSKSKLACIQSHLYFYKAADKTVDNKDETEYYNILVDLNRDFEKVSHFIFR